MHISHTLFRLGFLIYIFERGESQCSRWAFISVCFLGSLTLRRLNYEALRVIYSRVAIARKYLGFEMGLFFPPPTVGSQDLIKRGCCLNLTCLLRFILALCAPASSVYSHGKFTSAVPQLFSPCCLPAQSLIATFL